LAGISDFRQPQLITYPLAALLFAGILMFVWEGIRINRVGDSRNRSGAESQDQR